MLETRKVRAGTVLYVVHFHLTRHMSAAVAAFVAWVLLSVALW